MTKQLHSGHRQRLKKRAHLLGLEGLEKHEILELMLYFFVPRKDTNTIAHRLLDKFGSLAAVLNADFSDLLGVSGMTEKAALFLSRAESYAEWYYKCLTDDTSARISLPRDAEAAVFFIDSAGNAKSMFTLTKDSDPKAFARQISMPSMRQGLRRVTVLYRGINPYPETWDLAFIVDLAYLLKAQKTEIADVAKICQNAFYSFFKYRFKKNENYEFSQLGRP